ncbi:MAG: EAL domain-containing protein [Lachnospiraceae bacterium]|nr:EAL domain-containing protein [Lachnospiraceae bacterium]
MTLENTIMNSISFVLAALTISTVALVFHALDRKSWRRQNRIFVVIMLDLIMNALSAIVVAIVPLDPNNAETCRVIFDISQLIYFFFHSLLSPLFYLYILEVTGAGKQQNRTMRHLFLVPAAFCEIIVVLNPINSFVFRVDPGFVFIRGKGEYIIYAVSFFYLVLSIVYLFSYWFYMSRKKRLVMAYSFTLAIIGILLQLFHQGFNVELMFESLGFMGVLLHVEKEDDKIEPATRIYNRTALRTDMINLMHMDRHFHVVCVRIMNIETIRRISGTSDADVIMRMGADYLRTIHPAHRIYRSSQSSFMLLIPDGSDEHTDSLVKTILDRFEDPFSMNSRSGMDFKLVVKILCTKVPEQVGQIDDILLLSDGDIPSTDNRRVLMGDDLSFLKRDVEVEAALRQGIKNHNYEVCYQPIYDWKTKAMHGAEAKLVFHDKDGADLMGNEIVPIAKKAGIMDDLADFLLEEVFLFLSTGIPIGMGLNTIAVDVSALQCIRPAFLMNLKKYIKKYSVNPGRICLQFYETSVIKDYEELKHALDDVRRAGFKVILDNYASGDANAESLSRFDYNGVTLDMASLPDTSRSIEKSILTNTVNMMKALKYKVLIRGISEREQVNSLKGLDVDLVQGTFYSEVVTQNEIIAILKATEMARTEEQKARAKSEAKSSFLANMSHEIRTPINAILGMNEMILRESSEEHIREYSHDIERAGMSLLALINDILDFSKIEAGSMEIVESEYELSSMIHDVLNMVRIRTEEKGLKLNVDIDENIPERLYGDEIRFRQILINIMNNAAKYTNEGSVTLKMRGDKSRNGRIHLICEVIDTGIGIKEEDQENLFGKFQRLDMEKNRSVEGSGLGLAITYNLLTLMKGSIGVRSKYGEGTTFTIMLPQKVIDETPIGNLEKRYRSLNDNTKEYKESFKAPDARILVVDDTPMNLTVIKSLLKRTELNIDTCTSGVETLEMVKEKKYDIIFLDYRMPEMDGSEVLRRLKLMDHMNVDTPVVVLTANALSGARERFLKEGFDDYLTKPVVAGKLEETILKFLPEDKAERVDDEEIMTDEKPDLDDPLLVKLRETGLVDVERGLELCGDMKGYEEALEIYLEALPDRISKIKEYFDKDDIDNYVIVVHSLKSTSRVIGALELGDYAERMEKAGDDKDIDSITKETDGLLQMAGKVLDKLSEIVEVKDPDNADDSDLPMADEGMLEDAYQAIYEFAQSMDHENVSYVLSELANYSMPESEKETMKKIRSLAGELKWDDVVTLLENRKGDA